VESTFRLGRVAGIEIGVNWSWLLVVVLVVWSLASGVFPETNPGLSDGTYLAMAVVAAALFFASLFLHELGHALQARREGVEIDGITLWVFGGVARFKGMFPSAGAEFRIAIAGPLVSLVLGLAFLGFSLLVPLPPEIDGVSFWLGYINLSLLAFNLLPALPLDGGRVLRAALWARKKDFAAATRIAARLGGLFGQLMIVSGLFLVIFVGAFGGVWLAFIGWFLLTAAAAEQSMAEARTALAGLRAADVMVRNPVVVDPDLTLDRFIDDVFFRHRHTAYPVVAPDGTVLGIVSFRRVAEVDRADWPRLTVRDRMLPLDQVVVLDAGMDLSEALTELAQNDLGRALVVSDGRLVGLLSITDASRLLELRAGVPPRNVRRSAVVPDARRRRSRSPSG
jgi:Zn-dependent protease/CBS domain-containing protein